MAKRLRRRKMKDGELAMYWGRVDGDAPDVVYEWRGDGSMRRDSRLLAHVVGSKRPSILGENNEWDKSFLEELEVRGYDLSTMKFSIMKKTDENPKA